MYILYCLTCTLIPDHPYPPSSTALSYKSDKGLRLPLAKKFNFEKSISFFSRVGLPVSRQYTFKKSQCVWNHVISIIKIYMVVGVGSTTPPPPFKERVKQNFYYTQELLSIYWILNTIEYSFRTDKSGNKIENKRLQFS